VNAIVSQFEGHQREFRKTNAPQVAQIQHGNDTSFSQQTQNSGCTFDASSTCEVCPDLPLFDAFAIFFANFLFSARVLNLFFIFSDRVRQSGRTTDR
jgi:hypothetical protein